MDKLLNELLDEKDNIVKELEKARKDYAEKKIAYEENKNDLLLNTDFSEKKLTNQEMRKAYVDNECKTLKKEKELAGVSVKNYEMQLDSLTQKIELCVFITKVNYELGGIVE